MSRDVTAGRRAPRLGLVTIGQAPRIDLIPDVAEVLHGIDWVEHGALDLLNSASMAALAPRDGERELVSRLRDGTSTRLGSRSISPHLDSAISRCVADGCSVVLVLCTGRVEHGPVPVPVLHAEDLAHQDMALRLGDRRLGVLCPVPEQLADIQSRWSKRLGRPVAAVAVDPYNAKDDEIAAAGRRMAEAAVDEVFLDCIGYTERHGALVAQAGVPSHTARRLAVRAAVERL